MESFIPRKNLAATVIRTYEMAKAPQTSLPLSRRQATRKEVTVAQMVEHWSTDPQSANPDEKSSFFISLPVKESGQRVMGCI